MKKLINNTNMLVYKYRGVENKDRDIEALINNEYFASPFTDLNDPFENLYIDEITSFFREVERKKVNTQKCQLLLNEIKLLNNKIGIYSLSKSPYIELMWAHYANSSKGFCIEYDLEKLIEEQTTPLTNTTNIIKVVYHKDPPHINISDIQTDSLLEKIYGSKSKTWKYEKEIRIIRDNFGIFHYNQKALRSIYFGYSTEESLEKEIINKVTTPGIKFYRITRKSKTYKLTKTLIHQNKSEPSIALKDYKYLEKHNPTVENFYVKTKKKLESKKEIETFINNFKNKHTSKQANIILFDNKTNLEYFKTHNIIQEDEKHIIAELLLGMDSINYKKNNSHNHKL